MKPCRQRPIECNGPAVAHATCMSVSNRIALLALCGVSLSAQTISFLPPVNAFESGSSSAADLCSLCIATADFNGDGKMDILYSGTEFIPFAGVLLGNGDGTFRAGFSFNPNYLPSGPGPVASTFAADFNGDGKTDVALSSGVGTQIYLGRGDGTFILLNRARLSLPTIVPIWLRSPM